jgi:hypothetical protein
MVDWTRNSFSRHVTYLFIRYSFEFVLFSVVGKKLLVHWKNCTNSKKLCPGKAMPNSSIYIIKLKATCFWYVFFIRFLLSLMNLNNGVRSTENKNKKKTITISGWLCFSSVLEILFVLNIKSLEEFASSDRQGYMQLGHSINIADWYQIIHGTWQNTLRSFR